MLRLRFRFPLGVYHAQSVADFSEPEWPPDPVRVIAALIAAAHGRPGGDLQLARKAVDRLATASPPRIVAPRSTRFGNADGDLHLARLRGASRWAPRNHTLAELTGGKGISPRDLGRGRAEVHKVGVAVGELPVVFEWPDLELEGGLLEVLRELVCDVTVLGTARSPVIVEIDHQPDPWKAAPAWSPAEQPVPGATPVRVPTARTPAELDTWHARRVAPSRRDGRPASAPYVPPAALGRMVDYRHDLDLADDADGPVDPRWWGDLLVLAVDQEASEVVPRAPSTFAFARAARKALLGVFGEQGSPEEAPPVLRGRGGDPHAALVPLSFVGAEEFGAGAHHADGRTVGLAIVLPHAARLPDVVRQRLEVERGLRALVLGHEELRPEAVRVPGVGNVRLGLIPGTRRLRETLRESHYRRPSRLWSTVTPLVHSRYQARRGADALFEQVVAECRDVGLPEPASVTLRRVARFRRAPNLIGRKGLPDSWTGPLRGPQAHLDLRFDREVTGPVLLGRARHFGLGLCLPFEDKELSAQVATR